MGATPYLGNFPRRASYAGRSLKPARPSLTRRGGLPIKPPATRPLRAVKMIGTVPLYCCILGGGYGYRQVLELVQNGADAILEAEAARIMRWSRQ